MALRKIENLQKNLCIFQPSTVKLVMFQGYGLKLDSTTTLNCFCWMLAMKRTATFPIPFATMPPTTSGRKAPMPLRLYLSCPSRENFEAQKKQLNVLGFLEVSKPRTNYMVVLCGLISFSVLALIRWKNPSEYVWRFERDWVRNTVAVA